MMNVTFRPMVLKNYGEISVRYELDFIHFQRCLLNANPVNAVY